MSPPAASQAFAPPPPSSPPLSSAGKGRVASQVAPKNFSRPFMAPREQVAPPSRPFRSDSVDSIEGRRQESSVGHGSSLEHSSSIGHSSQGAHSMSRSWEERQEFGMRRHEDERRKVAAAMVASRGGEMEDLREEGRPVGRELDSPAPFTTYDSPPLHARSLSSAQGSVVYPSPNPPSPYSPNPQHARVPSPLDSQPDGYGFPRRPTTPPLNSPLSNPRVPPPTPPVTSFSQLTRESSYEDRRSRTSEGPDTSPRQRNVLRKPRPEQREPPHTPPVPSPSLSTASPPEHLGPWSRFRSKSKSRVGGSKSSVGLAHHDASNDYRFSNTTDTSAYSQTSSTPTITFQPPSRPIGDLNELAQRARELGEQKRRWEQMQLKPSVARSAQAGFVHAGEANVEPAWLSAVMAASVVGEDEMERLGAGALSAGMMRRTVSDQGPQRLKEDVIKDPSRPPSLYSNYSFYSLPAEDGSGSGSRSPASRQISPNPSPGIGDGSRFAAQQSHSMRGGGGGSDGGQSMGTLQKAKAGLKTAPSRTPSGKRAEPESAEDYLRT